MGAWEDVLIEWCNCLDISKKIQDFNELRNGDFFKNILYIINKSDQYKNDANVFKILLHILSKIYNNAQIEYSQYNSFLELSEDDLKIITSLLMHYTCIYDRRDILTSPLCHRLSKNTQVCIRSFLQKVDNEINYEDLEIIIKELSVNDNEDSFKNNDKFHSPLMGILKTPVSKASRFHEKDRELTKLKNMLELERYEKADLQEELRQQSEKIKKFESALNNSNSDIIRLKTQISALESRTPPHFQATDLTDKEKRLKMDIQSLEHYIEKTEKEQDDLREEAYYSRKKLKEWELEYSNLHTKYLEFENKVEDLTKLSINQTNRISTLEAYCDELNGLLEEYKTKSTNESCVLEASTLNVRRSLTLVEENLACSVVEVQLKDAQNENRELMMKIELLNMQLDHDKKMMETRMNEYVARYNKLLEYTNRFTDMKTDIVDLQIVYEKEMNEFSSYIEEMKQTFISVVVGNYETSIKNLSIELTKEKEISRSLSNDLAASILSFAECNKNLEKTLNEKSICQENFAQLEKVNNDLNKKIFQSSLKLNTSVECNKKYFAKIDTLEEENVKYKNKLDQQIEISQSLSDELSASILNFEECNKDLKKTLNEKNICLDNFAKLEKVNNDLNKKIQELSSNLNTSEDCNKKYLIKVESLEEENVECKKELNQQKEISQSLSDELSASILNFEKCNNDLERTLNEKNICLGNFAKLEKVVDDLNKKTQELSSNLNTSEDCNKKYSVKIDRLEEENVEYKNALDQQKEITQSLSDELSASILNFEECKKNLERTLNEKNTCLDNFAKLEKVVDDLNKKIQELSSNLNTSEECNKKYSVKIHGLEEENVKYKNELDQQKEISQSLSDKLSASTLNFEECNKNLERNLNEKNICLDNFAQLEKVVDDLNKKIQELSSNLNTSEDCNKKYSAEIDRLKEENVKYKNEIDQQKEISQSLSDKLEASILNFEQLNKNLEKTLNEKSICQDRLAQHEKVNDDLNKKIQELSSNLNTSEDCNKKYMAKIDTLKEENVKYKNELNQQNVISQSLSDELSASIKNVEQGNQEFEKL
ncbi:hypothetical protein WA026_011693 [Henosepilachna vigintioctopunctata]|uniref:Uncharacterized protein n=1 Tax=Henosepilachna vigintioctopunctata TaxID=420089 RepID=A0AAW1UIU3_9CUCU